MPPLIVCPPYYTGTGGGGGPTPATATVFLMQSIDQPNNGTTFVDTTGRNTIIRGSAVHSTDRAKFDTSSMHFPATGDTSIVDSPDFTFGALDWTIDFWINFSIMPTWGMLFNIRAPEQIQIMYSNSSTYGWCFQIGAANDYNQSQQTAVPNVWYHIALVRYGPTVTQYVDGVSTGNTYAVGTNAFVDPTAIEIGKADSGWSDSPNMYLEEFRVVKGLAVWTSDFTPPTSPYSI